MLDRRGYKLTRIQSIASFPALFGANLEPDLLAQILDTLDASCDDLGIIPLTRQCCVGQGGVDHAHRPVRHRSLPALRLRVNVPVADGAEECVDCQFCAANLAAARRLLELTGCDATTRAAWGV